MDVASLFLWILIYIPWFTSNFILELTALTIIVHPGIGIIQWEKSIVPFLLFSPFLITISSRSHTGMSSIDEAGEANDLFIRKSRNNEDFANVMPIVWKRTFNLAYIFIEITVKEQLENVLEFNFKTLLHDSLLRNP